ncbi:MAG: ferritin-like domain-containing protein [Gemmatimonadales bacterium]
MSLDNLELLLIEQLQDIYYAEKHLVKALPKMAKAATAAELKQAFTDHLAQTEGHVSRLDQVFEALGVAAKAKKCPAIDGLIQEASEMMEEEGEDPVIDTGLVASAKRVEHYEIAAYSSVKLLAESLDRDDVVALLDATLTEENAADELLTEIVTETIIPNALALGGDESEDEEEEGAADPGRKKKQPAKSAKSRR